MNEQVAGWSKGHSGFAALMVIPLLALLGGCPPTTECLPGFRWDGARCVANDAGLPDAPGADAPRDAPSDAGPCGMPCTGTTPFCDETSGSCVECLGSGDCSSPTPACVAGACEQCDDNADCTAVGASLCDTGTSTCGGCGGDPDCAHLTATPMCDVARMTCIQCTIATEAAQCGANSCNPATGMCTMTPRMTITSCGACVADSECRNADERCVPMDFMGTARPTGYCLKQLDTGCMPPYGAPTPARVSLSGAPAEAYCGIRENLTTCEAVIDLVDFADCVADDDCGAVGLADGRCETVNGTDNKCTYSCTAVNQCEDGFDCIMIADRFCGAT